MVGPRCVTPTDPQRGRPPVRSCGSRRRSLQVPAARLSADADTAGSVQSTFHARGDQLHPRTAMRLGKETREVVLHGFLADAYGGGYSPIGVTLPDQPNDV